jgi:hypothetical protein
MTLGAYAFLHRWHARILLSSLLVACVAYLVGAHLAIVLPVLAVGASMAWFGAPHCLIHFAEGVAFDELDAPDMTVHLEHDRIRGVHGSHAPVRFSRLVEIGLVRAGRSAFDALYFLRASDGAWCAFPRRLASATLEWHLRSLDGFIDISPESDFGTRVLWK